MATNEQSTSRKTEGHHALYASYLARCNARDFPGMQSFYTNPINVNDEAWQSEKVTAQFAPIIAAFPDWHYELRHLTIEGDLISCHYRVTGTHLGEYRGVEATGRRVEMIEFAVYEVVEEEGRFGSLWNSFEVEKLIPQITG